MTPGGEYEQRARDADHRGTQQELAAERNAGRARSRAEPGDHCVGRGLLSCGHRLRTPRSAQEVAPFGWGVAAWMPKSLRFVERGCRCVLRGGSAALIRWNCARAP